MQNGWIRPSIFFRIDHVNPLNRKCVNDGEKLSTAVLNLEVEEGVSLEALAQALSSIKGCELEDDGKDVKAYFPSSNTKVFIKKNAIDDSPLTEALEDAGWRVGRRGYFEVDPSRGNALYDVRTFIETLADLTSLRFVLSFGYESVYAFYDNERLTLSEDFK